MKKTVFFLLVSLSLFSAPGESSYPYISGYTWWHFSDWKLTNPDFGKRSFSQFDPEDVHCGDTIFVEYDCLEQFVRDYLPRLKEKVILITANYGYHADRSLPGPYAFLLEEEKIFAWFVQNIDRLPNEKLIAMPIGLASSYWPHGDTGLLDQAIPSALQNQQRSQWIYLNFSVSPERVPCANFFQLMGVPLQSPKPYKAYLQDLADSVFVISPPGGGIDCHRTWEALLLGCYPVVQSTTLDPLFADLPVVIVQNWEEVSEEFLQEKYRELKAKTWSREKLYSPYWFQKVQDLQEKVRVRQKIAQHASVNSWKNAYYDVLFNVINTHQYKSVLEVGVALGGHAESILTNTELERYIGVDPYRAYDPDDGFHQDVARYSKRGAQAGFDCLYEWVSQERLGRFGARCKLIRKASLEACEEIEDESLDCIFIDGDHRYEAVIQDLAAWFPKVKKGHLMTGDDYGMAPVAKAVDEFFAQQGKEVFFFTSHSGYKIWAVYK